MTTVMGIAFDNLKTNIPINMTVSVKRRLQTADRG